MKNKSHTYKFIRNIEYNKNMVYLNKHAMLHTWKDFNKGIQQRMCTETTFRDNNGTIPESQLNSFKISK